MFLPGIGGHLKVSHMDPRVSFGNESTNLSVQKSFLPFYIKSSHPGGGVVGGHVEEQPAVLGGGVLRAMRTRIGENS